MESNRTPLGHQPFKGLKSRLKEPPAAAPKEPQKPVARPAMDDPEAERQFFLRAMEGIRPVCGPDRKEGRGEPPPAGASPKAAGEDAVEG